MQRYYLMTINRDGNFKAASFENIKFQFLKSSEFMKENNKTLLKCSYCNAAMISLLSSLTT